MREVLLPDFTKGLPRHCGRVPHTFHILKLHLVDVPFCEASWETDFILMWHAISRCPHKFLKPCPRLNCFCRKAFRTSFIYRWRRSTGSFEVIPKTVEPSDRKNVILVEGKFSKYHCMGMLAYCPCCCFTKNNVSCVSLLSYISLTPTVYGFRSRTSLNSRVIGGSCLSSLIITSMNSILLRRRKFEWNFCNLIPWYKVRLFHSDLSQYRSGVLFVLSNHYLQLTFHWRCDGPWAMLSCTPAFQL